MTNHLKIHFWPHGAKEPQNLQNHRVVGFLCNVYFSDSTMTNHLKIQEKPHLESISFVFLFPWDPSCAANLQFQRSELISLRKDHLFAIGGLVSNKGEIIQISGLKLPTSLELCLLFCSCSAPESLPKFRPGDRVGVLVTPEGQLQIFVNGKWRLDGPKNVDISNWAEVWEHNFQCCWIHVLWMKCDHQPCVGCIPFCWCRFYVM